ncbi:CC/Se motif family (seleno)protein [Sporomusa sp.]|uniref:CC/Se motif family (seleno)protein n=1 Tax=Sporomusa sp. TaxID=2078658 RepID=UPI002BD40EAE|nr:CC/Se motif family (seleno)protein [Sporomusa sp.]HWR05498.1 CC/Se motif family (seleno)protein [Sporomusa sp.]
MAMLSMTDQAFDYINNQGKPVYLELFQVISCCIDLRESPAVRLGQPHNPENYTREEIRGIMVYVPHELPNIPLTITLSNFFSFKKLVIEGWQLA